MSIIYETDVDGKWEVHGNVRLLVEPSAIYMMKQKELEEEPVVEFPVSQSEIEIAQLWYENMITKSKLNQNEEDVAELWYTIIMGGVVNV